MFTGLVQHIGKIRSIDKSSGDLKFEIETDMNMSEVQMGASICCSGCCLTVVDKTDSSFFVDVSNETLSKTNLGAWEVMTCVNLEPSLKVGDEMGGHFVSGHIDSCAQILSIEQDAGSRRIKVSIPEGMSQYIPAKGSITIDGISLTVNKVCDTSFNVNIIPHTWDNTTLSDRNIGDDVNIEIDMLARYVRRMIEVKDQA